MENAFGITPAISAAVVAALAFIIFGGVKRIAAFTALVVPFMAQACVIVALVIVFMHVDMLADILKHLSSTVLSAWMQVSVPSSVWPSPGVSSVASILMKPVRGTGPHASSAASVSHPVKQRFSSGLLRLRRYIACLLCNRFHDFDYRKLQRSRPGQ